MAAFKLLSLRPHYRVHRSSGQTDLDSLTDKTDKAA
jgi:hypothetical protein